MRNQAREEKAQKAAQLITKQLNFKVKPKIGIVLGTGWGGEAFRLKEERSMPFGLLPEFEDLVRIEGHDRRIVYGTCNNVTVVALRGRVHLNEGAAYSPTFWAVRLQIEMMIKLGVKALILTCGVGSLSGQVRVGNIVIMDGFVTTLGAPVFPLCAGEFCCGEDVLKPRYRQLADEAAAALDLRRHEGGHVIYRGPGFEGPKYDKNILAASGAISVGMSVVPEAYIAALYETPVLGLGFVTNTAFEVHSHTENLRRSEAAAPKLGRLLSDLVSRIYTDLDQPCSGPHGCAGGCGGCGPGGGCCGGDL